MRTVEAIKQEYANLCSQVGDRMYTISKLQGEMQAVQRRLPELEKELQEVLNAPKQQEEAPPDATQSNQP